MNDLIDGKGYIFNFSSHGAFAPDGKIEGQPTQEAIDAHNKTLADLEIEAAKRDGKACLYLHKRTDSIGTPGKTWNVGSWNGSHLFPVYYSKKSFHNMAGRDGRTDVWFIFDDSVWHGVNIGDNDIVRCKRTKEAR